ncbi:hypothetical protein DPMN_040846 [Dreissena polymorpha]|uniref:Integrase core domain-containing protein n=1 Tax=Dreissena polymorpha TaxID=45954 RepID=A0A9D4CYB7_DREPO|nr:hypothetical protein DPMN_040846 [Dreissena polymorpha]
MIMFIEALGNNKSESLLKLFTGAIKKFGTPFRSRTDMGMENVRNAEFMLQQRGIGSVVTGKNVHNQRIERVWRDVYDGVLVFYSELVYFMKDEGVLDIMNPLHICTLHYVYMGRINQSLVTWCEAWSTHRHRIVKSFQIRLWTAGMANNQVSDPESAQGIFDAESETVHDS